MPARPDVSRDRRSVRRTAPAYAWTGARPGGLMRRRSFAGARVTPAPVVLPVGRAPASHGWLLPTPRRCNRHRSAAREAASFNPTLDRARATPGGPLSAPRLRVVFHGLPTRRSAKRQSQEGNKWILK
jgi:hypothetical protein